MVWDPIWYVTMRSINKQIQGKCVFLSTLIPVVYNFRFTTDTNFGIRLHLHILYVV